MDKVLKKRLVGTAVIVALAVIFVPMLLEGPSKEEKEVTMQISIPPRPTYDIPNRLAKAESAVVQETQSEVKEPLKEANAKPMEEPVAEKPQKVEEKAVAKAPEEKAVPKKDEKVVKVLAAATPELKKPEPKSPAKQIDTKTASAGFVIQVGSFSSESNAKALSSRLKSAGYPAFVESSKLKTSMIYRVKVGPKPSKKLANQLRIELIDEEKLEGIIVRYP